MKTEHGGDIYAKGGDTVTELIGAAATTLAIAGVLLNNRRMIACFYLWLISNAMTACLHYQAGLTSLVVRDVIFSVLAIEGLIRWRRKGKGKP